MKSDNLHIAISSDANYAKLVSILLVSLFDNNKWANCITVHLLSNNIDEESIKQIERHIPCGQGFLNVYDISDINSRLKVRVPPTISISSYSRLFLSSLLSSDIDKVIYMDVDAIVSGSLEKLWNTDMKDYQIAGVLDDVSLYAKKAIGLSFDTAYVNAGFLVLNIKQWREEGIEAKILDYLIAHNGNVFHHDQGLINAVCIRKMILSVNYNMVTNFFVFPYHSFKQQPFYSEEEMEDGKKHPIFIHFTAGVANRPWMENCKHPLKDIFLKYKARSLYKNVPLEKDSRSTKLKILASLYYHCKPLYYFSLKLRSLVESRI
nr:glycosyltransferase [uncultured Prevotella sp.]